MLALALLILTATLFGGPPSAAGQSVAREWNEEILAAIRIDRPNPPVHARNLFHLAGAMYDAWAAYDDVAAGYLHHERAEAADADAARHEAISYAAYRVLRSRYQTSASAAVTAAALDARMVATFPPATDTVARWTGPQIGEEQGFYRVVQMPGP